MCGDRVISVEQDQYHGCWCPGSLRRQNISTHDADYVEQVSHCLTRDRISTTCDMQVWRDDSKNMFMFLLKNLACKELITCSIHPVTGTYNKIVQLTMSNKSILV